MTTQADTLSDLPNRNALNQALKQQIEAGNPVALALLDIDSFSEVNLDFGQSTGDAVLRTLAGILSAQQPGQAYHFSGDEFALVLPAHSLEQAFLRMEGLRQLVYGNERFALADGRKLAITIGVAQFPRDAKDTRGLVQAADAALASAKESGRNQVSLPPNEEMVMKSCYYAASSVRRLKLLAERLGRKESPLLREALDDLFRKYDVP
ncbi:MAG TPA: diguanylate cyclase [Kouleothrix sp.]|uniref:diguanylate cyclase domain-containing protein n=1 Tax=Kouleothrix sp. TaxID=2779161 RepID=UPI002B57167B|nr:diguanylate cyclase [Kouleothrix sp.]HRC77238.1 diguanylate cyclase [Kouleothrix sp.]